MGNLSNLYISQSFQSLIHLGSDTTISTASVELQDGYGNGLKLYVNNSGSFKATEISASIISASIIVGVGNIGAFTQSVNNKFDALQNVTSSLIAATASYATTGSNSFYGTQYVNGDFFVTGQITANSIHTLYETSSVVFSSGSNILGDATNDTQTLIGSIIMSGSGNLTGSLGVSVDVIARGAISSSTLTGMGNVTNYSASVYNQFYAYSQSLAQVSSSTQQINVATSSLYASVAYINQFTSSTNTSVTNLSLSQSIDATKWTTLSYSTASINAFTASNANTSLNAATASYATTGSNSFTGSLILTGSAYGNIVALTIVSNTASIDMSRGNFFTLTLSSSATTRLEATNIKPGETANLLITQPATSGSLVLGSMFKTSTIYPYQVSATGSTRDLVSLISFDTTSIYTVGANKMS